MSKLAVFDLDGTLFRTETSTVPAIRQAFRELQAPQPDRRVILSFFGKPTGEYHAWLRAQVPPAQADALIAKVDELEIQFAGTQGELYPGVELALAEVQALGVKIALCSNGPPLYVERVLTAHNVAQFFDRVRCWRADGDDKFTMIGELLGELRAGRAVVVGDRGDDIAAAHRHGAAAIGVTYGYGSPEEVEAADAWASAASEWPGLIQSLLG